MKTKLFTLLLAVAAGVETMFAWDYERVQIGDLYYNLDATNQTAEVTYKSYTYYIYNEGWGITTANIPASVTYNEITYSVTSFGEWAFSGCTGLTSIEIPNSVTSIGDYAFYNCKGLTSVTIPNGVTSIGDDAFWGCSGLTSIEIPNSVASIGNYAFYLCSGLTSVTIPNSVKSIGNNAFSYCKGLTSIEIPNSVTSIGSYAFHECSSLTSVTIPNSVTSIGSHAFAVCTSLTSIAIPNSVTSIGYAAFGGCSGLPVIDNIRYADTYLVEAVDKTLPTYSIKEGTRWIGDGAFYGCSGLASVTIPNSVTNIGDEAFEGCSGLTSVTIPNSVTSIGDRAFYGCSGLTSVTIGNSVTSIGDYAFYNCKGLTSIAIPNSVTSIGYAAFGGCSGLPVIDNIRYADTYLVEAVDKTLPTYSIKEGTRWIGSSAFSGCSGLTSVTIPNSVTSIGKSAFSGCSGLTSIVVENGNFVYDSRNDCKAIIETATNTLIAGCRNTIIPNSVTSIGSGAFGGCTGLTSVTIPNSVTSIGSVAFWGCSLTSVTIPNSVTSIGEGAFYSCSGLTSVTIEAEIPPTLSSIPYPPFCNTNNTYPTIYVPCGTLDAYKTAWTKYASRISYAPLPYKISTQAENGSVTTNVATLTICEEPVVTCTAIANYGYHFVQWSDGNTDNPRTIELTQDTTFTAEFARNTYTISTASSNPEWGTTAGDKSALYLDEVEISATANYGYHFVKWNDNNTSNPRTVTISKDTTFTATFAKNVYSITANAAHGSISGNSSAEYLDEVTLSISSDYGYHFVQWNDGNTDNPRTIVLTQDTTFTAEFAVDKSGVCGDENLLRWEYADGGVLTISGEGSLKSNYTFGVEAPTGMQSLVVSEGVTAIGDSAFTGKPLTSINLPLSLKTIGKQAFSNNNVLKQIVIPNGITSIGDGAFENSNRLQEIVFGESVETIGVRAFNNCPYIITIHAQMEYPPVIDASVFANCGDLSGIDCYVQQSSLAFYKKTNVWKSFNLIAGEKLFSIVATPYNTLYGTVSGSGAYAAGVEITLVATPKTGYHFTCWNDGNTDNPRTITVAYDASYTAIFSADTPSEDEVVQVTPTDDGATITTGKVDDNAVDSYSLAICQDGDTICVLTMDAEGRLTGINFRSAPARRIPQQTELEAGGLNIPVTGLEPGTTYHYTLDALDVNKNILDRREGDFTTSGEAPEGINDVRGDEVQCTKVLRDGQIFILRGEKTYTLQGQEVK